MPTNQQYHAPRRQIKLRMKKSARHLTCRGFGYQSCKNSWNKNGAKCSQATPPQRSKKTRQTPKYVVSFATGNVFLKGS
jgi:hypothetical protein